ncbi:unnamed protein product [Strongylus vulgaris]|uniref:Uncharacterized protein n=1 Tax=Strongylus vulgaris TaxID=40348 RepID=A0A3P7IRC5_STRVU|nr:unnamed protein product [Strongylus vulgaris]
MANFSAVTAPSTSLVSDAAGPGSKLHFACDKESLREEGRSGQLPGGGSFGVFGRFAFTVGVEDVEGD